MDFSRFPSGSGKPSPRQEIQGPRPTPLKVRKDSHKVKKPPVGPQPVQHRLPVIIYTVSPKVIHTNPNEFMSLVQRLTGASASSSSSSSNISIQNSMPTQVTETEQRLFRSNPGVGSSSYGAGNLDQNDLFMTENSSPDQRLGFEGGSAGTAVNFDRNSGILSPMPASLPMISPNFFSNPMVDTNSSLNFMHDLSPANNYYNPLGNTRNFVDNSFLVSPSNLLSASIVPSPAGGYWDLFNQYNNKDF